MSQSIVVIDFTLNIMFTADCKWMDCFDSKTTDIPLL